MIQTIKYSLGGLESEIMEIVWKHGNVSVRQVLNILRKKRNIAYTTIMTVMTRLAGKGILKRELQKDGAYLYYPVQGKKEFLTAASKKAADNLIKSFGELAVAQFIDAVESSDLKSLERWRQKLGDIK